MGSSTDRIPFVGFIHYHYSQCKKVFDHPRILQAGDTCPKCGKPFGPIIHWTSKACNDDFYSDMDLPVGTELQCPVCEKHVVVIRAAWWVRLFGLIESKMRRVPNETWRSCFGSVSLLFASVLFVLLVISLIPALLQFLSFLWGMLVSLWQAIVVLFTLIPDFFIGFGQSVLDIARAALLTVTFTLAVLLVPIVICIAVYLFIRLIGIVFQASVATKEREDLIYTSPEIAGAWDPTRISDRMTDTEFIERLRDFKSRFPVPASSPDFPEQYAIAQDAIDVAVAKERDLLNKQQVVTGLLIVVICFGALICYTSVKSILELSRLLQRVVMLGAFNVLLFFALYYGTKFFIGLDKVYERLGRALALSIFFAGTSTLTVVIFAFLPQKIVLRGDDLVIQLVWNLLAEVVITGFEIFGTLLWERPINSISHWLSQAIQWLRQQLGISTTI